MRGPFDRRHFLGTAAGSTAAAALLAAGGTPAYAAPSPGDGADDAGHGGTGDSGPGGTGDGGAGARQAPTAVHPFPLTAVTLLPGAFRENQARNTAYLRFVDPDRLLHTFRLNVGLPTTAQPCGGWEAPTVELRGHTTGHLLSGLALTCANTGEEALRAKGERLVAGLAQCQERATAAGFGRGYLSAFPESFFDRLEAGTGVWAPYYTIHKIMAGLLDQYRLAGNG